MRSASRVSHTHVRKAAHERMTASGQEQYERAAGTLQWVLRIARVKSQAMGSKPQLFVNKILKYLKKDSQSRTGVLDGDQLLATGDFVLGSFCDASHADEHCERTG